MATTITPEDVLAIRGQYPGVPVLVHINTALPVKALAAFYKVAPDHIVAIHDELDIDYAHRTEPGGMGAIAVLQRKTVAAKPDETHAQVARMRAQMELVRSRAGEAGALRTTDAAAQLP